MSETSFYSTRSTRSPKRFMAIASALMRLTGSSLIIEQALPFVSTIRQQRFMPAPRNLSTTPQTYPLLVRAIRLRVGIGPFVPLGHQFFICGALALGAYSGLFLFAIEYIAHDISSIFFSAFGPYRLWPLAPIFESGSCSMAAIIASSSGIVWVLARRILSGSLFTSHPYTYTPSTTPPATRLLFARRLHR